MTEERMLRAFSELDMPAMPDPAFADRLYASLAAELGLEPAVRATAGPVAVPVRPVEGSRPVHPTRPEARTRRRSTVLVLLAAALVLLALVAGTLLIAGSRPQPLSPLETMERSRTAYVVAPAIRFVVGDNTQEGVTTVTGDGRGTWRSTSWDMAPESYMLYDGTRVGTYDATSRVWQIGPVQDGGPPYPFNSEFTWTAISFPDLVATLAPVACKDAEVAPPMTVAGRQTEGIACPSLKMTYWADTETGLVLRAEAADGSPYYRGPANAPTITEVTSFEVLASADPAAFDWSGPPLPPRTGKIPGTKLVVGERPATWTATDIDGAPVELPGPGGPTALLFWASWCPPAVDSVSAFDDAVRRTGVRGVVVATQDERGTVLGLRAQHPWTVPTAVDQVNGLGESWGLTTLPMLVLLDADGRVVDVVDGNPKRTDIGATLAALADGEPIPAPGSAAASPSPAPTASPGMAGACTGDEEQVLCWDTGARVPAWQGRTDAGDTVSDATLLGRPAVIWFEAPARCDGPCPEWVLRIIDGLGQVADAYLGRASVLLIAPAEPEPGDTRKLLGEEGAAIPVVFDWDGAVGRAIGQQTNGAALLDADGRVVKQWVAAFDPADVQAALDDLLAAAAP